MREANQHGEAFALLGKALEAQPEQPELLYDHALTAEKLERFEVLEGSLRKLIRLKPDHAHAHNALGYSFAERNLRLPEARKLIERALELAPEDYYIVDSLAGCCTPGRLKAPPTAAARHSAARREMGASGRGPVDDG